MAPHDPEPNPQERSEHGNEEGVEPQWPREVPEQEVKPDLLCVLKDEDEQQSAPDKSGDRSSAQSASAASAS